MLEIKNLTKVYKSKGGVVVKALDDISIKFPSTGLVFLLGKSGSGKSTLLNVTGGLDKPDDGEIIIKGRNSKTFSGPDFDSYRNTFIGFIFQEYNILNEFNVEQNISLALQLQGKKNDKDAVDAILKAVDLEGYGKRKPNTLSGGQKQRIAIARALIKNPEIIMADEPTGALDSNTGKQVFDTLKKLSKEKLIIVVSHDRDFAETYGDRIIELSDGKVISDVTKEYKEATKLSENVSLINDNVISIKAGKTITDSDMENIKKLLMETDGEVILARGENEVPVVKQASHVRDDNRSEVFNPTEEIITDEYNGEETKFIKSRLPMARAVKMGSSSLKTKPIRMIFTCLLTIIALVMFGAASTLLFYDPAYSIQSTLKKTSLDYERVVKTYEVYLTDLYVDTRTGEKIEDEFHESKEEDTARSYFSESDLKKLNKNKSGVHYIGIYSKEAKISDLKGANSVYYFNDEYTGYTDASFAELKKSGFKILSGHEPENKDEIAISQYMADSYIMANTSITSYEDLVGREVNLTNSDYYYPITVRIAAVYDCGKIPSKYDVLKDPSQDTTSKYFGASIDIVKYIKNSYHTLLYVNPEFFEEHSLKYYPTSAVFTNETYAWDISMGTDKKYIYNTNGYYSYLSFLPAEYAKKVFNSLAFYDLDGNHIEYVEPKNNQVYLSKQYIYSKESYDRFTIAKAAVSMLNNPVYSNGLKKFVDENEEYVKELNSKLYASYDLGEEGLDEFFEETEEIYNEYVDDYITHKWYTTRIENAYDYVLSRGLKNLYDYDTHYNAISTYLNEYLNVESSISNRDEYFNEYILANYNENKDYYENITKESQIYSLAFKIYNYENLYSFELPYKEVDNYYVICKDYIENNEITDESKEDLYNLLSNFASYSVFNNLSYDYTKEFNLENEKSILAKDYYISNKNKCYNLEVLGYYDSPTQSDPILSIEFVKSFGKNNVSRESHITFYSQKYQEPEDMKYDAIITKTSFTKAQIHNMLQSTSGYKLEMTDSSYEIISQVISIVSLLRRVFLISGLVFAIFASLMLFNFISSSISAKTKEIGILRAIGTRGSDLFKIFFSESGIIASICFVLSIIGSIVVCYFVNKNISEGIGAKIMEFGFLNALYIILGSVMIAFVGTFIPVFKASKKPPIDSIRTL